MSESPVVTISSQQMYDIVLRVEKAAEKLANGVDRIENIVEDHELRIRAVESRADVSRRMDSIEDRMNAHEAHFTRIGERLGALEAKSTSRLNPVAVAGVIAAFISITVALVLGVAQI